MAIHTNIHNEPTSYAGDYNCRCRYITVYKITEKEWQPTSCAALILKGNMRNPICSMRQKAILSSQASKGWNLKECEAVIPYNGMKLSVEDKIKAKLNHPWKCSMISLIGFDHHQVAPEFVAEA